jgi:glutathione S-transferase
MPAMKLHYHPASTTCRSVMLLAAEEAIPLELELELVDLFGGENQSERFLAINPNGAVPVLEDGPFRLTECSAILKYLAEQAGSAAYPAEPRARARVNALMDWFNTGFYRDFGYGLVYPQVMPQYYGWPDPAMQAAALLRAEEGARRWLDVLDEHWLAGEAGPYLGGAAPCLADHMGAAYTTAGELMGFDFAPWPRVLRWLEAMRARPSWAPVNAAFRGWCESARAARSSQAAAA